MTKLVRNVLLHQERTKKLFLIPEPRPRVHGFVLGAMVVEVISLRQPLRLIRG